MHTCTRWDFVSFQLVLPLSLSSSISCASWWVLALITDAQAHFDNCEQCTCRRGLVYALSYVGSFNTVCPSVVSCILYQSSGTSWSSMPHCLVCQDTSFLSLIYFFDQMLVCSFEEVNLDSTSLVWFCLHQPPLRNAVQREITVKYRDPWMGCILRPKLSALDFRKRTRERMGTLGGNHICFRKSLSQTFNLIRLDFSSMSPRFPFFCCFVATQPSIRNVHKWFEGKAGSARLEHTPAMDLQLKGIRTHM